MNPRLFSNSRPFLLTMILTCSAVVPRVDSQTDVSLSIQTYAGLTITGSVGTVYTVQFTTDLAESNEWHAAGLVQLPRNPYLWVDTSAPSTSRRFYRAVEGQSNLVWIPPGTFTMGSPSNGLERWDFEGPQTVVTLTHGFFIGKYEVNQDEYQSVMSTNPSYFLGDLSRPVDQLTWYDATNYCGRLTEQERQAGRLPNGWVYRLPTDAEWEYACRAGTTTAFYLGQALRSGMANFIGSAEYDAAVGTITNATGVVLAGTVPVGSYAPNGWGLYDMIGNAWEWCQDWCSPLAGGLVTDPQCPARFNRRVARGGGFRSSGRFCRSAYKIFKDADYRSISFGCRVVLAPSQP